MIVKAVLFDLHNTLAYLENPLSSEEVSDFLIEHGCKIYPQSWDAASHFVGMLDYPREGYSSRQAFLRQVLNRLGTKIDDNTLDELAELCNNRNSYSLFPDSAPAIRKARELGSKTAIVTTIPDFVFSKAIEPLEDYFDTVMTGYKAGCEKSNPLMLKKTLKKLNAKPSQAVMIGDELLVDIKIPKKFGMRTILLDRSNKIQKKPNEADEKAATLTEAMNIIEKWHRQYERKQTVRTAY